MAIKSLTKNQVFSLVLLCFFLIFQMIANNVKAAPESLAPLVETVSPAVVNITTSTTVAAPVGPQGIVPEGSPFEDLFRDFQDRNGGNGAPRNSSALGSGFVISSDGYVITNNHVIEDADEIRIEFRDGMELEAKVVGVDKNVDIALLKVEHKDALPYVQFGDSDISKVGDWVMAVGNPLGQGFSVSVGIISARNRELSGAYDDYIQTDAAINRGNSGGPLFNMDGKVIGVNTAILSPNGGSIGIGFSMSSNVVAPVVDQLREFGEVRRGWLGVNIGNVTEDMAEALGLVDTSGAIVLDVFDGPALDAGLKSMDIIISFDGQDVGSSGELVRLVGKTAVGKTVNAIIVREGAKQTLSITLGQRPDPDALAQRQQTPPKQVIKVMVRQFLKRWQSLGLNFSSEKRHDLITLASIIEKETGASFERPTISGVFHNRLKRRMRLQSDPTTIYGIYESFTGNLRKKHLLQKTPYNTYKLNIISK